MVNSADGVVAPTYASRHLLIAGLVIGGVCVGLGLLWVAQQRAPDRQATQASIVAPQPKILSQQTPSQTPNPQESVASLRVTAPPIQPDMGEMAARQKPQAHAVAVPVAQPPEKTVLAKPKLPAAKRVEIAANQEPQPQLNKAERTAPAQALGPTSSLPSQPSPSSDSIVVRAPPRVQIASVSVEALGRGNGYTITLPRRSAAKIP